MTATAYRAAIAHCIRAPQGATDTGMLETFDDGLLVVNQGKIVACGDANTLLPTLAPEIRIVEVRDHIIVPGFVDAHVHAAQLDVIASPGTDLLDWLERFTFPAEAAFADANYSALIAGLFCDELLRNGTTSAMVFPTVHAASVDALFAAAQARNLRITAGKVLMDRHCPANLRDTVETGNADNVALIARWHDKGRLRYAVTPRFAVTSSEAQLAAAAQLQHAHDLSMQTHLAENHAEIAEVARLFPKARSYLDVYEQHGLLGPTSVFAHGIHLDARDRERLRLSGASIAHCPTSNLFLGSGLMDLRGLIDAGINVALATDVGGGTSFSMLRTMGAAYQIAQLRGFTPSVALLLYLATLGGAKAMNASTEIGNFEAGKDANFVLLNPKATALLERRTGLARSVEEQLFVLLTLGDERAVARTFVIGDNAKLGSISRQS